MYEFVAGIMEDKEAKRAKDDQAKAAIAKKKRGNKNEDCLPDDFVWDPSMKTDIDCPNCGCRGTVQKITGILLMCQRKSSKKKLKEMLWGSRLSSYKTDSIEEGVKP